MGKLQPMDAATPPCLTLPTVRRPSWRWHGAFTAWWLLVSGCAPPAASTDAGTSGGFQFPGADVWKSADVNAELEPEPIEDAESADESAPEDTGEPPKATVLASTATATVALGTTTLLTVQTVADDGTPSPATTTDVAFEVDGAPLAVGAVLANPQPPVSVWKGTQPGQFVLAGVRPGTAQVVAKVADQAAPALAVSVVWPDTLALAQVSVPSATGAAVVAQAQDAPENVQLKGSEAGVGGLTVKLRFPANAQAGKAYTVASGQVAVEAVVIDAGNTSLKLANGQLWLDQVDKGAWRGTFLGQAQTLAPMAGVFIAERAGKFGVDLLSGPVQVAKSVSLEPATGDHFSRATVQAIDGSHALVLYRRISNVAAVALDQVQVDGVSGAVDGTLPPVVAKVPGAVDEKPVPGLGYAAAAALDGQTLVVWEGRAGMPPIGQPAPPSQLWARVVGSATPPLLVADMPCEGKCRPQVVSLAGGRWLVLWAGAKGQGIYRRVLNADLTWQTDQPETLMPAPAGVPTVARLDANVGIAWSAYTTGSFVRFYDDQGLPQNPEQPVGAATQWAPRASIVALPQPVPTFFALFFSGSPANNLRFRRIGLDGIKVGATDGTLWSGVDHVVAAGRPGQVAVVARAKGKLLLGKLSCTSPVDPGMPLGAQVVVPVSSSWTPEPTLAYLPEADVFVLAWSGDQKSDGVWMLRFR
jgi:hypothetical protein